MHYELCIENLLPTHACAIYPLQKLQCAFVADVGAVDDERFGRGGGDFKEQRAFFVGEVEFPRGAENQRFARCKFHCVNDFFGFVTVFGKIYVDAYSFRNVVFEIVGNRGAELRGGVVNDDHTLGDKSDLVGKKLAVSQGVSGICHQ